MSIGRAPIILNQLKSIEINVSTTLELYCTFFLKNLIASPAFDNGNFHQKYIDFSKELRLHKFTAY